MTVERVDYDRLAATYDQRFGTDSIEGIGQALRQLVENSTAGRVLEVGCGTGHWLELLAPLAASLFGLDASGGISLHPPPKLWSSTLAGERSARQIL